jgi:hypothetical protein
MLSKVRNEAKICKENLRVFSEIRGKVFHKSICHSSTDVVGATSSSKAKLKITNFVRQKSAYSFT